MISILHDYSICTIMYYQKCRLFLSQTILKNINTCPVDRKVFYTITVKKANNEETVEEVMCQIYIFMRMKVFNDYEMR